MNFKWAPGQRVKREIKGTLRLGVIVACEVNRTNEGKEVPGYRIHWDDESTDSKPYWYTEAGDYLEPSF